MAISIQASSIVVDRSSNSLCDEASSAGAAGFAIEETCWDAKRQTSTCFDFSFRRPTGGFRLAF